VPPIAQVTRLASVSERERTTALSAVTGSLRCPVCGSAVRLDGGSLRCDLGHSFDVARQGYVNLAAGRSGPGTADTAEMVAARERFLGHGHYAPLANSLRGLAVGAGGEGLVVDLAGGTGYYLAAVLDGLPGRYGLCVDLSVPALRRAARAHPRAAAIAADVWRDLPVRDQVASLVLSVFGPRNPAEIDRVLAPGGALVVVTPGPDHLRELRETVGMIGIDERKSERLAESLGQIDRESVVKYEMRLDQADAAAAVLMGPSAHHVSAEEVGARVRAPITVTADLRVQEYRR
jgi:23S rRNA (guanine745-N1)-methyltransferase